MAEQETLIQKFAKKYFTNTPANMLRSINAGKFLYRYFVPDKEVPEDPVTLLNITHTVMLSDEQNLSDENFVRAMLNYFNSDPSLITFDMVADLLESDAYKHFVRTSESENDLLKTQFENWLVHESMFAYIDSHPSFDVVMNLNSIKRIAAALNHWSFTENDEYRNVVNRQLEAKKSEFDDDFVSHADENAFDKLVAIVHGRNLSYTDKIKKIYGVLCDEDRAAFFANNLDAITMGAENSQARNAMLEGAGLTVNKILFAFAKRQGWTKEKYQQVVLKFPVEERAQQFEEHAAQFGTTQAASTTSTQANHEPTENIVTTQSEANATQAANDAQNEVSDDLVSEPNRGNRPQVKFNPVLDVVKTFGITLGGATAISAISAIPGVGSLVGPVLGITTVVSAGITSGLANLHKAQAEAKARGEKLKKSDGAKIALKTGIAMMGKAAPYALAMALGPKWRAVGAGLVMVKSIFRDLERRANLQREAVEQLEAQATKQPKGIRARLENFLDRCKNVVHNVNKADVAKSVAYGLGKGAAVYLGGQIGRELGSNLSFSHKDGLSVRLDTAQIKKDLSEDKLVKFVGNTANHVKDFGAKHLAAFGASQKLDLSDENLARLDELGKIELTDNARATAYVKNDSQYIDGVKHQWYSAQEQRAIVNTLEKAGVDDPYGVLRKLGSAERFEVAGEIENNGFQETMSHLKSGTLNNQDAQNIFKALDIINEEGGLGRTMMQEPSGLSRVDNNRFESSSKVTVLENSEPAAEQQLDSVPVSRVDNDRFATEAAETVLTQNTETNLVDVDNGSGKLSSVGNNRFETGMKESILDENFTVADVAQPDVESVNTSRVDNDRFDSADAVNILNSTNETSVGTVDDATAIAVNAEVPVWKNDGSYAAKVYQDLVDKCDYAGPTVDGSYSFTDKDGTYYEINPDTHEMHISRFSIEGGADIRAVDLTDNAVTQDMLKTHATLADVINQDLSRGTYSDQESEILELTKSAHEILANPDTSFVDRQRATVQLERLNAWLDDIKTDHVENVVEPVVDAKETSALDDGMGINAEIGNNENQVVEDVKETSTEKLSEFNPKLFDNLKIKLDLNDINEQDEIKFEAPVENAVEAPAVNEIEPEIKTPEIEQEQPNLIDQFAENSEEYNWDLPNNEASTTATAENSFKQMGYEQQENGDWMLAKDGTTWVLTDENNNGVFDAGDGYARHGRTGSGVGYHQSGTAFDLNDGRVFPVVPKVVATEPEL